MSNRVLLISGNFYPEPTGIGKYSGEMIDWLSENGYQCTVITTFPYYPDWKVQMEYSKSRFWYKKEIRKSGKSESTPITIIRCPHYIPTSPTGFKRLLSEFTISFFSYLALFVLFFAKKYTYVMTVAPPFELGFLGVLYKKIRGGIFVYHIQDLQVDAARELGMIKSSIILKMLFGIEKYIIKNADYISSISDGMIKKIQKKCSREIVHFPNWVDTSMFYPIADKTSIKLNYGLKSEEKIIMYSGAIGEKQGLSSILYVAKQFQEYKNLKFIICGSGPYKTHLINLKEKLDLPNVLFLPLQPGRSVNKFLNMADIHLILQKSNASDLVMPSKLSTILAVGGVAIVTANPGTSLYEIMNSTDMGFLIEPENQEALTRAIHNALSLDNSGKMYNARTYAEHNLSIEKVLSKFDASVLSNKKREGSDKVKNKKVILSA